MNNVTRSLSYHWSLAMHLLTFNNIDNLVYEYSYRYEYYEQCSFCVSPSSGCYNNHALINLNSLTCNVTASIMNLLK